MSEADWGWAVVDPETRELRRFFKDGAVIAARGQAPSSFWEAHPLVTKFERSAAPEGGEVVRVWYDHDALPDAPETPTPDRPADLKFSGGWRTDYDFWAAHPDVEHVALFQFTDDDPANDGWSVSLWLSAARGV
jgi:hypothetical protein